MRDAATATPRNTQSRAGWAHERVALPAATARRGASGYVAASSDGLLITSRGGAADPRNDDLPLAASTSQRTAVMETCHRARSQGEVAASARAPSRRVSTAPERSQRAASL